MFRSDGKRSTQAIDPSILTLLALDSRIRTKHFRCQGRSLDFQCASATEGDVTGASSRGDELARAYPVIAQPAVVDFCRRVRRSAMPSIRPFDTATSPS
jgi:hypothetical protein